MSSGCPESSPDPGDACDIAETCTFQEVGACGSVELPVEASCIDGKWRVLYPVTCEPQPDMTCDPLGNWLVEPAPIQEGDLFLEQYNGPFEVSLSLGENGLVYVANHDLHQELSPDGCDLNVSTIIDERCFEDFGEEFCSVTWRGVLIKFSTTPIEATVYFTQEGEGGGNATTTATVTKQP